MTTANAVTVTLDFERETKRMARFQEVTDDTALIGTLYISKELWESIDMPETIEVTVTAG